MPNHDPRDRIVDELLRRTFSEATVSSVCVDADTLGTWHEGSLGPEEAGAVELHLASCARCRAALATLVRLEPMPAARPSFWGTLRAQWLVPLTAAAAVSLVAIAIWGRFATPDEPDAIQMVSNESGATASADLPSAPSPATVGRLADEERQEADREQPAGVPPAPVDALAEQAAGPASEPDAEPPLTGPAAAPAAITVEPPAGRGQAARSDVGARDEILARDAPLADASPPNLPSSPSAQPAARQASGRGGRALFSTETAPTQFASPDGQAEWQVAGGVVSRRAQGQDTWTPVDVPADVVITAGAAPAPDVCWLVGRAGAVFHTADGLTFTRRPFPSATTLVAVTADSASTALVTDETGRRFRTIDGGTTWNEMP